MVTPKQYKKLVILEIKVEQEMQQRFSLLKKQKKPF